MDESLQNQMLAASAELMNWARDSASNAENFIVEQTPLFVQEYLTYYAIKSGIVMSVWLVLLIVMAIGYVRFIKFTSRVQDDKNWQTEDKDAVGITCVITGVVVLLVTILGLISFFGAMDTFVKIKVAPRVFMVESLAEQITRLNGTG